MLTDGVAASLIDRPSKPWPPIVCVDSGDAPLPDPAPVISRSITAVPPNITRFTGFNLLPLLAASMVVIGIIVPEYLR